MPRVLPPAQVDACQIVYCDSRSFAGHDLCATASCHRCQYAQATELASVKEALKTSAARVSLLEGDSDRLQRVRRQHV